VLIPTGTEALQYWNSLLEDLGMEDGFMQEYESASYYYRPDFTDADKPFKDIRDFGHEQ